MGLVKIIFLLATLISQAISLIPLKSDIGCPPNPPPARAYRLSMPLSHCPRSVQRSLASRHPDQNKRTPEILETYGYPYTTYNVTTKDGYILTAYRITGSPNLPENGTSKPKQAVYLQHGLTLASDCWNFQPGSRNLPFKLADAGYEVWLNNARGTSYSLGHTTLNSDVDLEYWNFSWHEMGMYDVPAITDKIIEESGNEKIFYVGHSMGTTMYFVSLSEISEMNGKVKAGFMLSPSAYQGHMNNPVRPFSLLASNDAALQPINKAFRGQLPTAQEFREKFGLSPGDVCDPTITKCGLCDNLFFLFFGYNTKQLNNTELPNIVAKTPNSSSMKTLAHYAQSFSSCSFSKYDYGTMKNPMVYGSTKAPVYPLDKITAPTYFFYGEDDNMGPPNDVMITASKFSPGVIQGVFKVNQTLWNHMDFITAKDADKFVYNRILSEMQKIQ